jgi:hypothetical protein
VFRLFGALNLPPSPSALLCPASALPARGFFCTCMFAICFYQGSPAPAAADVCAAATRHPEGQPRAGRLSDNRRRQFSNAGNYLDLGRYSASKRFRFDGGTIGRWLCFNRSACSSCPPARVRCCPASAPPDAGFFFPDLGFYWLSRQHEGFLEQTAEVGPTFLIDITEHQLPQGHDFIPSHR